nr:hypothetical protein [uncultured Prevotella sp.]
MEKIIDEIIQAFSSLWKFRKRGESLEIITPVPTSNDGFVSVFLTRRGNEYVVTDGGWIDSGLYDVEEDVTHVVYRKIIQYYLETYGILSVKAKNLEFYYKKTTNPIFIPNLVFDVSAFISGLVSTTCAAVYQVTDKSYNIFSRKASNYLKKYIPQEKFVSKSELKGYFPSLSFNAAIKISTGIALVNYATGSTDSYYISSLCKSQTSFEMVKQSDINNKFHNRILLLDDSTKRLSSSKVGTYVDFVRGKQICDIDYWGNKESLKNKLVG